MRTFVLLSGLLAGLFAGFGAAAHAQPIQTQPDFSAYAGVYYSGSVALTINADGSGALDGFGATPDLHYHRPLTFFNALVGGENVYLFGYEGTPLPPDTVPLGTVVFSTVAGQTPGQADGALQLAGTVYPFCEAAVYWQLAACNGQGVGS